VRISVIIAILLIAQMVSPVWVAVLQGDYPSFDPSLLQFVPMPDGTHFSVINDTASYAGHYGNYTVAATKNEHNITLVLYGDGESKEALGKELAWVGNLAGISPDICPNYTLQLEQDGNYSTCKGTITVYHQEQGGLPPVPAPPNNNGGENNGGGEVVPQGSNNGSGKVAPQGWLEQITSGITALAGGLLGAIFGTAAQQGQAGTAPGIGIAAVICPLLALVLIIIIAFMLIMDRQAAPSPSVDPEIQKLLENETRSGIMQELSQADKIPTHLSLKLGVSKPAIVGRLAELVDAGLVEKVEVPGKKFVHYRLTQKGRQTLLRMAG